MPNYSFVIDSSFQPFTLQEMIQPWAVYSNAYEKTEDDYIKLSDQADKFKYLSNTLPEGSRARQLYEGYANDLNKQAEDLAKHGLNINNRKALLSLKRRYQGEIGRLEKADEALKEQLKIRDAQRAKGLPMLYAEDNLSIDNFLDSNTPNLYSINSDDLYNRGAALGKSISSRIFNSGEGGNTLGGYYKEWKDSVGIHPDSIAAFIQSDPVQQEIDKIMKERGATDNLQGANYNAARQAVLNGLYNSIVYQESVKPIKRDDQMTEKEEKALRMQEAIHGLRWNPNTKQYEDKNEWMYTHDALGNRTGYDPNAVPDGYQFNPITNKLEKTKDTTNPKDDKTLPNDVKTVILNNGTTNSGQLLLKNKTSKKFGITHSVYPPLFFDAWERNAKNGIDATDGSGITSDDLQWYDANNFKSGAPKKAIKDFLVRTFDGQDWTPEELERIYSIFIQKEYGAVLKDFDPLSDNHWAVTIPGVDTEGKVVNENLMNQFLSQINKVVIDSWKAPTKPTEGGTPETPPNNSIGGNNNGDEELENIE